MTPKTISLETADRERGVFARSLVEFFSAEPFLGFPIVQRWADAEGRESILDRGALNPSIEESLGLVILSRGEETHTSRSNTMMYLK